MATNYYVDGAVGNDSNLGTSEGSGNALLTIEAGVAKLTVIGDHLYIKASVTYGQGNTTSYPLSGSTSLPIITEGYTSTPGDGGMVTIDTDGTDSSGSFNFNGNHIARNITIKNFTLNGFNWANSDSCRFENCQAIDNNNFGFAADNYIIFDKCVATGNNRGIDVDYFCTATNCYVVGNTVYGIYSSAYSMICINCVVAGGSAAAIGANYQAIIVNCTIDGYGTDVGLDIGLGLYGNVVMNCIFHDCTTAIKMNTSKYVSLQTGHNNMMNSNTANYSNWSATSTDFSGTPSFVDEAGGDYDLAAGSDAIGAGYGGIGETALSVDCGAHQIYEAPGGSSRVVLTS